MACALTVFAMAVDSSAEQRPLRPVGATASSEHPGYPASKAIDGEVSDASRWVSVTGPGSEWLQINFSEEHHVGGIHLYMGWGRQDPIREFSVEFMRNGEWVTIPSAVFSENNRIAMSIPFDDQITVETTSLRIVAPLAQGERARIKEVMIWPYSGDGIPSLRDVHDDNHDDSILGMPMIFLNQSGFNLGRPKRFTAPDVEDGVPFQVREVDSDEIGYEGIVSGAIGDFSNFNPMSHSEFVVTIGDDTSVPFRIGTWWLERATSQLAVDFMVDSRHYVGDHRGTRHSSYAWRDNHHFAFELDSLARMYMSNPSAYERMPSQISYEAPADASLWGALLPYDEDAPDVVKMMHWAADVIVTQKLEHMFFKSQLAHFLYSWPWIEQWLPRQNFDVVLEYARSMWPVGEITNSYPYDTITENHNLFEIKTEIGTTKGENPPGHSILPNLLMYEVGKRELLPETDQYFAAAYNQTEWMISNLDWNEPILTKGQRMSERITVIGLTQMAKLHPDRAPAGLAEFMRAWADVMISRSDNMWDFRKLSATEWVPTGAAVTAWNEPGNVMGFPSCIFSVLLLIDEAETRERLERLAWSHFDNCFGRNPTGRHFSHRSPNEIEGVVYGWYSFHDGGIGQLQNSRFVFDGAPKNEHYPFNPQVGDVGWTEGWVNFNTAFNDSLALLASAETEMSASWEDGELDVELRAPLNFDYETVETATVDVLMRDGSVHRMQLVERSANDRYFVGQKALPERPVKVRYGYGYLAESFQLDANLPDDKHSQLVSNPGFEDEPFAVGWTASGGVLAVGGFSGTAAAVRLPWNSLATLAQAIEPSPSDFTAEVLFQIAGSNEPQAFRWQLESDGVVAVDLRTTAGGWLQLRSGSEWLPLISLSQNSSFGVAVNQTVRLRVVGRDFGTADASYDLEWSNPGQTLLVNALTDITSFASDDVPAGGLDRIAFVRNRTGDNSFVIDDATVVDAAVESAMSTHRLPVPDKVVEISGVYPHLVMTNAFPECGVGAVVPWAGRLWAITYAPHSPRGSDDKLYEIFPDLTRVIRPESVGGTPANRFIHTATNQLVIGHHFIDSEGNVRTLSPSSAPGRMTATAAHLTDPNRLYLFTMESGVYDVDATDLSFIVRYPDVQPTGDRFIFGYHGKGAYTGQGHFVVGNNGRPNDQNNPLGPAGVLATWDGTTVADHGGVFTDDHLANPSSQGRTPAAPLPHYLAGWNQVSLTQTCEVTGPGGIYGNADPVNDPIWATGFDAKSVLLHVMEDGEWNLWRLPKGTYSADGSHGWHTEWPRIRQLDPEDVDSIYLMHMHGIFFDFPRTFSSANFGGLQPISNYYKMPTDYAVFNGRIVMGKNDASRFDNPLARSPQSNFWFGTMDDIRNWGAPAGHGALWMNDAVAAGDKSDPFLIDGFEQRTLHLRNLGAQSIEVAVQTSAGSPEWTTARTVNIPAGGYVYELLCELTTPWVRLRSGGESESLTAFFHLYTPYPHPTPASTGGDEFSALADIRDTRAISDGVIRLRNLDDLSLELASSRLDEQGGASEHRYHIIGGDMVLRDTADSQAESELRIDAATSKEFDGDAASVWMLSEGTRYRLPRLDEGYEAPFAAGWARGVREVVTERNLLNLHGTFYEIPRANSGGYIKMRPLSTHGKRITDFASWRGLFVMTGVLNDAPASDNLVRNVDGSAALWLGEVDDLWRMGEPRGIGGPWLDSAVAAGEPSDPYLMYGYDRKKLQLTAASATVVHVEVDFLADNTWSVYASFELEPGQTVTHLFPEGFHAHWVRVVSDTATTATAQFNYGPGDGID